jgi:hypothetical protein
MSGNTITARFLKAMLTGVGDDAQITVEQVDEYNCRLVIEEDSQICTIGEIGITLLEEK